MKLQEVSDEYGITCTAERTELRCTVLHQTGGKTARSAASYLSTRPDGSVNVIVDDKEGYRTARPSQATCGVRDVNSWTWHEEQAAPFGRHLRNWLRHHIRTINRAAYHMARVMVQHDIPLRFLSTKAFNAGKRDGWTTHKELSDSNISTSTHEDPTNYPKWRFRALLTYWVRKFRREGVPELVVVAR